MPLEITVEKDELWDTEKEEFIYVPGTTIHLEHSLHSVAKWESIIKRPYFDEKKPMTDDEFKEYLKCMTIEDHVSDEVYRGMTYSDYTAIRKYMDDAMTATWFKEDKTKPKGPKQIITAEIIYYYMVELGIPFECEHWHLNRLLTLIRVCSEKQAIPKKMAKKDIFSQNASLNAARRAKLHSKG